MQTWLQEAEAGEPRLILLTGDAGIGKSTLLAHLLRTVQPNGWLVLSGSCLQGARIAYLPLASALTPLRPERQLPALAPAALSELFLGDADSSPDGDSDSAADRRHLSLFAAITRALLEVADQGPIVLAIEDLHWADDSTLAFLEHLAGVVTQKAALTPVPLGHSRHQPTPKRRRLIVACRAPPEAGGHLPRAGRSAALTASRSTS